MAQKVNRRGLFGLFAKGAVAAPFVGRALVDAANAAPPVPVAEPELGEAFTAMFPGPVSQYFTISCSMGPYTDMRWSDGLPGSSLEGERENDDYWDDEDA